MYDELILKATLSTASKFYKSHPFEVRQSFGSPSDFFAYAKWLAQQIHPESSYTNKQIVSFVATTVYGKLQDYINGNMGYKRVRSEKGVQSVVPFAILEETPDVGSYHLFSEDTIDNKTIAEFIDSILDDPVYNPYQKVNFTPRPWFKEFMEASWVSSVVAQKTRRNIKYVSLVKRLMFQAIAERVRARFPEYVSGESNIKYITPKK